MISAAEEVITETLKVVTKNVILTTEKVTNKLMSVTKKSYLRQYKVILATEKNDHNHFKNYINH